MNREKKKWTNKRHKILQELARPIMRGILNAKYNYHTERTELPEGPCLIISNHVTTYDPFFVGFTFSDLIYYVASDDILSKKFIGPLLKWAVNPIPKSKSLSDIKCVKTIMQVISEGKKVCLFPEGNRTYDGMLTKNMDETIAKLCRVLRAPIVLYNIEGGYGSEPRWGAKGRKGYIRGKVKRILSVDEVKGMNNQELFAVIKKELQVDNTLVEKPFKSNKKAEFLDRVLYKCPDCGELQTIYANRNDVVCVKCGYHLIYNEDLTFTKISGNTDFKNVHDWYQYQVDFVTNLKTEDLKGNIYADDRIKLFNVFRLKKRIKLIKNGRIIATKDEITFTDRKHNISISRNNVREACVVGKHKVNFYVDDYIYQVKGDKHFNGLKYVQIFYHLRNIEKNITGPGEFLGI